MAQPGDLILTKAKAVQAQLGIPIFVVVPGELEAGIDAEILHVFGREVTEMPFHMRSYIRSSVSQSS